MQMHSIPPLAFESQGTETQQPPLPRQNQYPTLLAYGLISPELLTPLPPPIPRHPDPISEKIQKI